MFSHACHDVLRRQVEILVHEIHGLKGRKTLVKAINALTLYQPKYRQKMKNEFQFRVCIQSHQSVDEMRKKFEEMNETIGTVQIPIKRLETIAGSDHTILKVNEDGGPVAGGTQCHENWIGFALRPTKIQTRVLAIRL